MDKIEQTDTLHPEFYALDGWRSEMADCQTVDPANQVKYYNLQSEIVADEAIRMNHFLMRHDLMGQFLKEDSDGKR